MIYAFKVRARNIYGYGQFSAESTIVAVDVPGQISIPTVTMANDTTDTFITVDWTAPDDHYATITAYEILFKTSSGSFTTYSSCLGTDSTIVAQTYCTVDMIGLKSAVGLSVDSLIQVRMRA